MVANLVSYLFFHLALGYYHGYYHDQKRQRQEQDLLELSSSTTPLSTPTRLQHILRISFALGTYVFLGCCASYSLEIVFGYEAGAGLWISLALIYFALLPWLLMVVAFLTEAWYS
ncbi:hypothetical protein ACA910_013610 [Epithemia clementina (nom. ined.)]